MSVVVLNKEKHSKLKLISNPSCAHMKNKQLTLITLGEFARAGNDFPIVFIKDEKNGALGSVVLFGLQAGENVVYGEEQWKCTYAPMSLLRHPFVLAVDPEDSEPNRLSLCFEDDGYISEEEGQPIYDDNGEETDMLKHYRKLIVDLFESEKATYQCLEKLEELDLIVPFSLVTVTASEQKKQLQGLYTINAKKLSELDDDKLLSLHKAHYLGPIHSMINSLGHFNWLIKYKNENEEDPIVNFEVVYQQ